VICTLAKLEYSEVLRVSKEIVYVMAVILYDLMLQKSIIMCLFENVKLRRLSMACVRSMFFYSSCQLVCFSV